MSEGQRLRDEDVARVLGAYGTLGDGTVARLAQGVLTVRRGLDVRRVFWSVSIAIAAAGVHVLALTCHRAIVFDRFPSFFEVVVSVSPAVLIGLLGVVSARPTRVEVDGVSRTLRVAGDRQALEGRTLVLAREGADEAFDVTLRAREGGRVLRLRGVDGYAAARAKAIAVAIASWLDLPLVETSTHASREALHDADALLGLATPRARAPLVARGDRSRVGEAVETVVDVAVFAIELLNAL